MAKSPCASSNRAGFLYCRLIVAGLEIGRSFGAASLTGDGRRNRHPLAFGQGGDRLGALDHHIGEVLRMLAAKADRCNVYCGRWNLVDRLLGDR